jgi:hypothetical protein
MTPRQTVRLCRTQTQVLLLASASSLSVSAIEELANQPGFDPEDLPGAVLVQAESGPWAVPKPVEHPQWLLEAHEQLERVKYWLFNDQQNLTPKLRLSMIAAQVRPNGELQVDQVQTKEAMPEQAKPKRTHRVKAKRGTNGRRSK